MPSDTVPRVDLSALVRPEERGYFVASAAVGVIFYAILGYVAWSNAAARPTIVVYGVMFVLFALAAHGFMLGRIRGNAVRVSQHQFPNLHATVAQHAATLGMSKAPDVYVMQAGGMLNAFATRFLGRDFVVLFSDVLAIAERKGEDAVSFVVGHELGHLKRGHLRYRWLLGPSRLVPFLSGAYSRACEYTCDRFGAACAPSGAIPGLLTLAAGGDLYDQVDPRLFAAQAESESGFWFSISEVFASHPHLTRRVAALLAVQGAIPSYSPIQARRQEASSFRA